MKKKEFITILFPFLFLVVSGIGIYVGYHYFDKTAVPVPLQVPPCIALGGVNIHLTGASTEIESALDNGENVYLEVEIEGYKFNFSKTVGQAGHCGISLFVPTDGLNTDRRLLTTDIEKEMEFLNNDNYYIADRLEVEYVGSGSGEITGERQISDTHGSFFLGFGYIYTDHDPYSINDKLKFSFVVNPQYPTVRLNEQDFENTRKEIGVKSVRCVETEDKKFRAKGSESISGGREHPFAVICTFEDRGTHFLTIINSITSEQTFEKIKLDSTINIYKAYASGLGLISTKSLVVDK